MNAARTAWGAALTVRAWLLLCSAVVAVASCTPAVGSEGGACYDDATCDDALVCDGEVCVTSSVGPRDGGAPDCSSPEGNRRMRVQHTAGGACEASQCVSTIAPAACVNDIDCQLQVQSGDTLRIWTRPQGGIGTRLNARADGFRPDDGYVGLRIEIFGIATSGVCATGEDCAEGDVCEGGSCRLGITNQLNGTFTAECREGGYLLLPEIPIRFGTLDDLDALDGLGATVRLTLEPTVGEAASASVDVVLEVGEFAQPSWWDA
jgi:hypothetical protein